MTPYTPTDALNEVDIYDESDLVLGGTTGNSNLPIEALADQSLWLQNRIGGYRDVVAITGNAAVTFTDHANRLLAVTATANVTLTVDALSGFKTGNKIAVVANLSGAGGPFWVNLVTAENINNGSVTRTNIWLYDGEMIEIVAGASAWYWTIAKGNFDKVGDHDLKRFAPRNAFIADGSLGDLRAKYPRLWELVSATALSDATWNSAGNRYKGQFSTGNGTTTLRRPDYRGLFLRSLDGGRGLDLGRMDATAGGYEDDSIKDFTGSGGYNRLLKHDGTGTNKGTDSIDLSGSEPSLLSSYAITGLGTETRGKNLGFTPYIYF